MRELIADATIDDRDVRCAQALLDAWLEDCRQDVPGGLQAVLTPGELLRLRGLLAAQFADVRAAGVLEGTITGRQEAAQRAVELLRDALRGEGLA